MMTTSQSSIALFVKFHVLPVDSMCITVAVVLIEEFHIYCDYLACSEKPNKHGLLF